MSSKLKRKILWNKINQFGSDLFLDFITYVGSIVTILSVYFNENKFESSDIKDWIIVIFSLFVFIVWVVKSFQKISSPDFLTLKKPEFFEYVSEEKKDATTSVINIAGDMSWLIQEKETFKKLIEEKPDLDIQIFFEKEKIEDNVEIIRTIKAYQEFGIKMIAYPFMNIPHLKALLIDRKTDDTKFLVFKKTNDVYNINIFRNNDIALNFANAFIDSIKAFNKFKHEESNRRHIILGISGLNNIGKSTLVSHLKNHYKDNIDFIPDTFKHESLSTFEAAALALCHQLVLYFEKRKNSKSQLILFDRTPIDNLAFLYVRLEGNSGYTDYTHSISDRILEFIAYFDFIALLKPPKQNFKYEQTTHLDATTRRSVKRRIENLYNESHANVTTYYTSSDGDNFQPRLHEISNDIIKEVDNIIMKN